MSHWCSNDLPIYGCVYTVSSPGCPGAQGSSRVDSHQNKLKPYSNPLAQFFQGKPCVYHHQNCRFWWKNHDLIQLIQHNSPMKSRFTKKFSPQISVPTSTSTQVPPCVTMGHPTQWPGLQWPPLPPAAVGPESWCWKTSHLPQSIWIN